MNRYLKYSIVGIGLCLIFYLDFVRDYVFKNIGFQIYYLQHLNSDGTASLDNYTDSFIEHFIQNYSIESLTKLKWISTAIFSLIFGTIGALINSVYYKTKQVAIYFLILYGLLFICSFLIYLTINLSNSYTFQNKAYLITMEIAHFLQSSLPTLLFLVSFKLFNQNKK